VGASRRIIGYPVRHVLSDGLRRQATVGATWNLAGTAVSRLAALAATIAVVRVLGPTRFGGLALIQTMAAAIGTLSGLGLAFATTRFVAEQLGQDRRKAGGYLTSAVTLSVLSGTVFGLAVFVLSPQLATAVLGKRSLTTAMAMAAPLLLFSPLADVLIGAITGLQRFRTLGWLQGARGALDGVLLIIGALTGGIVGGIAGYVAAEAVSCVIAGLAVHRAARAEAIELHPGLDRTILPSLVRFLLPSLSTSLLLAVSLSLGQIFLAHQPGGLASVGVFVFAQRFYLAALFLPQVIGVVLFPLLSSLSATGQFHRFRRLLRGYLAVICFTVTLGAGALFLLAGFLSALRGHGGGAELHTLGILALVAIPTAFNNAFGQAAVALRRIGWWLFSDVILAIVLLGAAWLLVPRHGSVGLAVAYLLGYFATCLAILPAFLRIPVDQAAPEVAVETDAAAINWDVVLPTVGLADALPQLPTRVLEPTPNVEAESRRPAAMSSVQGRIHESSAQLVRESNRPPALTTYELRRIRLPTPKPRHSLAVPMVLAIVFCGVVLWSSIGDSVNLGTYPVLAIGPLIFVAVQLFSPRTRFRLDTPLCPTNWGWLLFAIQLVLEPALLIIFGPAHGQLSSFPGPGAVQEAFVLSCLAYMAYAVGLAMVLRRPPIEQSIGSTLDDVAPGAIAAFILVGAAAMAWDFHSFGQLLSYFTGGFTGQASTNPGSTSLASAASTFLRPLGAYGLILLWARSAESTRIHRLRFVLSGAGALFVLATYNYDRSAVVIPLIALVAAYARHIRKLRLRSVVIFGLLLLLGAAAFGNYREVEFATQGGRISLQQAGITSTPSLESQIQVYGAAPQFSGLVIQDLPNIGGFASGRTMIASVLSPLPVVGKEFRSDSGAVRYNDLVYGRSGTVDEVLPFLGELYWNFGPLGVIAGFFMLGMAIAAFQRRFDASDSILAAFICQYLGMWVAFLIVGSIEVVAQIFIYFTLPILAVVLAPKVRHRRTVGPAPPARRSASATSATY
jgi:O-antigen/teichoic acid export membrane protein